MTKSISDLRKVENEAVFRKHNEKIQKARDHLNKMAEEDNQPDLIDHFRLRLQYFCECSDESCTARISLMSDIFNDIHKDRKSFVIANGHEALEVETIVDTGPGYTVVSKKIKPPEANPKLKKTDVDNT